MFGESEYGEQEFAGTSTSNVFTKAFNEVVTMSDMFVKSVSKLFSETVNSSETFLIARLITLSETINLNDRIKKYVNGVSVTWKKSTKSVGSWVKETKLTDIWRRIRKQ